MNPYLILAFAGGGLFAVVALVAVLARFLVDRHAEDYRASTLAAAQRHQVAEYRAAVERIKAVAR
ncbi:MAG TPA: hypothetical protein VFX61_00010 [Micromonosporaceae bacterium]|nr:hypothetical protein [Micromonosporaceae bacterium]